MAIAILYHGTRRTNHQPHVGMCLTDSIRSAREYATRGGVILEIEVDLGDLVIAEVDGHDWDSDEAVGDRERDILALRDEGIDVVVYDDADAAGREHSTWRLVSERAIARVRLLDEYPELETED